MSEFNAKLADFRRRRDALVGQIATKRAALDQLKRQYADRLKEATDRFGASSPEQLKAKLAERVQDVEALSGALDLALAHYEAGRYQEVLAMKPELDTLTKKVTGE